MYPFMDHRPTAVITNCHQATGRLDAGTMIIPSDAIFGGFRSFPKDLRDSIIAKSSVQEREGSASIISLSGRTSFWSEDVPFFWISIRIFRNSGRLTAESAFTENCKKEAERRKTGRNRTGF